MDDSSSFERVDHEEEGGHDHPHIPSQSFVGLGRSLSLSASSVLSSVTGASSLLGASTEVPAVPLREADEEEEEETEYNGGFEEIRHEDALPSTPPPSFKLDAVLGSLLKPKGLLSAVVVYLAMYWRLRGTYMEGQAAKWEARYHEEVQRGAEANLALKAAEDQAMATLTALYTCQEEQSKCCVAKSPTHMPPYQGSENATKRGKGKVEDEATTESAVVHVPSLNQKTRDLAGAAAGHRAPSSSSSPSSSRHLECDMGEPLTILDNCILHLEAGPCTTEALLQVSGCVGNILTSSEEVLKDMLRHTLGLAQNTVDMTSSLFHNVEGVVDKAACGLMDLLVGNGKGCDYIEEEEEEKGTWTMEDELWWTEEY